MTRLDTYLQRQRIRQALPHLRAGSDVCDLGSYDGSLFVEAGRRLKSGVALDPAMAPLRPTAFPVRAAHGTFPDALLPTETFDAIVALAVIEHIPEQDLPAVVDGIVARLRTGGRFIMTTPEPAVDGILAVLKALRLVDAETLDQHHGFDPSSVPGIFKRPALALRIHRQFQLGLNHLFVFERLPDTKPQRNR